MAHGLLINNNANSLLIGYDATYLKVLSRGFVSTVDVPNLWPSLGYRLFFPGNLLSSNKHLFLRNVVTGGAIEGMFDWYDAATDRTEIGVTARGVYEYIITTDINWGNSSGYGLRINNSSGDVIFNSNEPFLTITSIIEIPLNWGTVNSVVDYNIPVAPYNSNAFCLVADSSYQLIRLNNQERAFRVDCSFIGTNVARIAVTITGGGVGKLSIPDVPNLAVRYTFGVPT